MALLALLIIIQVFRPEKNIGDLVAHDITTRYAVPGDVTHILKVACYDCHSNQSIYPWYWNVQPVAWFMNGHIEEGKHHLNFSEFATYATWRQYKKLEEIDDEIKSGDMPLTSYKLIHADARLSDQQKMDIRNWVAASRSELENRYPADSLIRRERKID